MTALKPVCNKVKIRVGAKVFQDFRALLWTYEVADVIFDAEAFDIRSLDKPNLMTLRAPGYGRHVPDGAYGNGAIHAYDSDLIEVYLDPPGRNKALLTNNNVDEMERMLDLIAHRTLTSYDCRQLISDWREHERIIAELRADAETMRKGLIESDQDWEWQERSYIPEYAAALAVARRLT